MTPQETVEGFTLASELAKKAKPSLADEDVQLAYRAGQGIITEDQVRVLKNTICAKFTVSQLQLYVTICARKGVDPFTEAYGFPNPDGGLAFGLRIDGMRALAMRTGQYKSRKVEEIMEPGKEVVIGARCYIEREGMSAPVIEEAYFEEYRKKGIGWDQYPGTMIRKVAEAKALRAAFPDALSGVYEPAEVQE